MTKHEKFIKCRYTVMQKEINFHLQTASLESEKQPKTKVRASLTITFHGQWEA